MLKVNDEVKFYVLSVPTNGIIKQIHGKGKTQTYDVVVTYNYREKPIIYPKTPLLKEKPKPKKSEYKPWYILEKDIKKDVSHTNTNKTTRKSKTRSSKISH